MSHGELKAFSGSLTAESFSTKVKCCACEALGATPYGLANHLKKHGAAKEDVQHLLNLASQAMKQNSYLGQLKTYNPNAWYCVMYGLEAV